MNEKIKKMIIGECLKYNQDILSGKQKLLTIPYTDEFNDYVDPFFNDITPLTESLLYAIEDEEYELCGLIKYSLDLVKTTYITTLSTLVDNEFDWDTILSVPVNSAIKIHMENV